jgi:hypothetical protein
MTYQKHEAATLNYTLQSLEENIWISSTKHIRILRLRLAILCLQVAACSSLWPSTDARARLVKAKVDDIVSQYMAPQLSAA